MFAQNICDDHSVSSNYSFSDSENDDKNIEITRNRKHLQFEGLSVMNVLGSLKNSQHSNKDKCYQNNAVSLPNIANLPDEFVFPHFVIEKKHFWEEVSSRSSSSLSVTSQKKKFFLRKKNDVLDRSKKPVTNKVLDIYRSVNDLRSETSNEFNSRRHFTEDESMNFSLPNMSFDSNFPSSLSVKEKKNFWEHISPRTTNANSSKTPRTQKTKGLQELKPIQIMERKYDNLKRRHLSDKTDGIYNSRSNTFSLEHSQSRALKKYNSVDDSLDNCTALSIEERKRLLLQQDYFKIQPDTRKTKFNHVEKVHMVKMPLESTLKTENTNESKTNVTKKVKSSKYDVHLGLHK